MWDAKVFLQLRVSAQYKASHAVKQSSGLMELIYKTHKRHKLTLIFQSALLEFCRLVQ